MPRKVKQQPVPVKNVPFTEQAPTIRLLDRFSAADLETWLRRSRELDELHHVLYHGLEPERIWRRQELLDALNERPAPSFEFSGWVRILEYRYADQPLSAAGSMLGVGGRFSIGVDCDDSGSANPFPALYIGDSHETAFREAYGMGVSEIADTGLAPAELALRRSDASIRLRGRIERLFDVRSIHNLMPIARILARFSAPHELKRLARTFKLGPPRDLLIRTPGKLQKNIQDANWRAWPRQFGLPSPSQRFGHLLKLAGYEGVIYNSARKPGAACLAVFPGNLSSSRSFVELEDAAHAGVKVSRLDTETAETLSGWELVGKRYRDR